jgi:hypothetical protein
MKPYLLFVLLACAIGACEGSDTTVPSVEAVGDASGADTVHKDGGGADTSSVVMCSEAQMQTGYCDDFNKCTESDACRADGACEGNPFTCDDGNKCTVDSCSPKIGCSTVPNIGAQCNDGDECTGNDVCKSGGSCVGEAKSCDDGNPCTIDACNKNKGCYYANSQGSSCEDGNPCTTSDACQNGLCSPGLAKVCNDGNACTTDSCDQEDGVCTSSPSGENEKCDDSNPCTEDDRCKSGKCASGKIKVCPSNPCHIEMCSESTGQCVITFEGNILTTCSDNDACTSNDTCNVTEKKCQGVPKKCNDSNECTEDLCISSVGCQHPKQENITCDDNDSCTNQDLCKQGVCVGQKKNCNDSNPCTSDFCAPSGQCDHPVVTGQSCEDGNTCTKDDVCQSSGVCIGKSLDCNDGNDCTSDSCNPTSGCKSTKLSGNVCSDGKLCTEGDKCSEGNCVGKAKVCDDGNPCTDDACLEGSGTCQNKIVTADLYTCKDPNNVCAPGAIGVCKAGGVCVTEAPCDDNNKCTTDACDKAAKKCVHLPVVGCMQ